MTEMRQSRRSATSGMSALRLIAARCCAALAGAPGQSETPITNKRRWRALPGLQQLQSQSSLSAQSTLNLEPTRCLRGTHRPEHGRGGL
jgi:hypothetical protein